MTVNTSYERETKEHQAVTILSTVNGEPVDVTASVELALLPDRVRPLEADWKTPVTLHGKLGVMLTGLTRGTYRIWYRVTDNPEIVVDKVDGYVRID
ncbi:hypothetical protein [Microbacterium sp. CJ88]|uniref:hypothetical protein n=1 Tax=Microbacterium sp. CJ88 TaxID=3445672 RepID=UPI003F65ED6E